MAHEAVAGGRPVSGGLAGWTIRVLAACASSAASPGRLRYLHVQFSVMYYRKWNRRGRKSPWLPSAQHDFKASPALATTK